MDCSKAEKDASPDILNLLKAEVGHIRNVQYPHIGDGENKICNAYIEDIKTVGYGRKETESVLTYSNPFDPRLTFNGLVDIFSCGDANESEKTAEQLAENVFLALENPSTLIDDYFNGYRKYVNGLFEPPKTDLTSDITKVTIMCYNSGRKGKLGPELPVQDDGTEECKALFERIKSDIVKCLFDENDEDVDKKVEETNKKETTLKQMDELSGGQGQRNCPEGKALDHLKSPKAENNRKNAIETDKELTTLNNLTDLKHNPKRWSEKCWTRRRDITNKRDVHKDAQHRQTESSWEEVASMEVNPSDSKNKVNTSSTSAESSTSTIEVTSQTFPPLASTNVCEESTNQQQTQLSDNWAEKLFKNDRTTSEFNHLDGIPENDGCPETMGIPISSRLSPTSKPFIPAILKDDPDDVCADTLDLAKTNGVPQDLTQDANQLRHPETNINQPTQTNSIYNYQQVYQTNPLSHSIRPTVQQQQQAHHQQQPQPVYWNQQRRNAYGGNTVYPSPPLNHQHHSTREKWPTSETQSLVSPQLLASQLHQLSGQGQHISPPPGFNAHSAQGMRYSQFPATHLDPAIQSFSRQIECNRVMEQQQSSAFTLLGTLSIPQRYSQNQSPQQQFFSNLRQPCYQTPVAPLQQQLVNYRPNWAAYNTNNNVNFNNSNHVFYGGMNPINCIANGNANNNFDSEEGGDTDNYEQRDQTVIQYSVSSIESIECDQSREGSSKERAKLKPKPTRSNLIQIVPTDE